MTINVDRGLCQGHGQCEEAAPEIFEVRDDGVAYVIGDVGAADVDVKVRVAIRRCPVDAISLSMAP